MPLSAAEFAEKWLGNTRNERSAAQEHFIDLCQMLGFATPNEDATGESYAFEKGADKTGGGDGFADVWLRDHFGWEYKGKHHDLDAAYRQLLQYREALGNPPLLIVCDLDRFIVHTNFNNTEKRTHEFTLTDLRDDSAEPLRVLRAVFTHPEALKPQHTPAQITEAAASQFASIARSMQERIAETERIAHFLDRLLFCFFAEDAGLLPPRLLSDLLRTTRGKPEEFARGLRTLFGLMSKGGGLYGTQRVQWFNGGLFDGDDVFEFTRDELATVERAAGLDWRQVDPAVLGTLFERGLDPAKRGQLGAHYTDTEKILMVVEPVVLEPLRREFAALRASIEAQLERLPRTRVTRTGRTQAVPAPAPRWRRGAGSCCACAMCGCWTRRAAPGTSCTSRCGG